MAKDKNEELEIFLTKAFNTLRIKQIIIILYWTVFKKYKRDKFLDKVIEGKKGIDAFYEVLTIKKYN